MYTFFTKSPRTADCHWVKNVQIRNFFWCVFSCIWTEYRKIRTKKTPYLDTFHTVYCQLKKSVYLTFYQYSQLDGYVSIIKSSLARFILAYWKSDRAETWLTNSGCYLIWMFDYKLKESATYLASQLFVALYICYQFF